VGATSYSCGSGLPRALRRPDPNPLSCSCTSDCSWRLCERERGQEPVAEENLAEESPGPVLLVERGFELFVREQASLDQELA